MDSAHEGTQPRGRGLSPSVDAYAGGFSVVDGFDVTTKGDLRPHSDSARKLIRLACEAEAGRDKDLKRCRVLVTFVDEGDL